MKTKKLLKGNESHVVSTQDLHKQTVFVVDVNDDQLCPQLGGFGGEPCATTTTTTSLTNGLVGQHRTQPSPEPVLVDITQDSESTITRDLPQLKLIPRMTPFKDLMPLPPQQMPSNLMPSLKPIPQFVKSMQISFDEPMDTTQDSPPSPSLSPKPSTSSHVSTNGLNANVPNGLLSPESMFSEVTKILTNQFPNIVSSITSAGLVNSYGSHMDLDIPQETIDLNDSFNQNQSLNASVIDIDLNEDSNSPKMTQIKTKSPVKVFTSATTTATATTTTRPLATKLDFNTNNGPIVLPTANRILNSRVPPKQCKDLQPFEYCAKDYRIFGMTRHSGRHKLQTAADDDGGSDNHEFEMNMSNATWSEIDGTQYEFVITKWSDEDRRKDILKQIGTLEADHKFVKSIHDEAVRMCFTAFPAMSSRENGLHCVVCLDKDGVKHQRFSALAVTRLYLVIGDCLVTAENGKQRKAVETGQELYIPAHTRYRIENKSVNSSYFYVIVTRN